jgi:two-component system nitrogen regulation sensor histidine kinase NtrY
MRTRIIAAFMVVALLPALPLSVLVARLLVRTLEFSQAPEIEKALGSAMEGERDALAAEKSAFAAGAKAWREGGPAPEGLAAVRFGSGGGAEVLTPQTARVARFLAADPSFAALRQGSPGTEPERIAAAGSDYLAMSLPDSAGRIVLALPLSPEVVRRAQSVESAVRFLRTAEQSRGALVRSLVLPFILIYALLLAIAAAVGALLAARIARPVEALVAATRRVGAGDLDARVEVRSDGETRALVTAFNEMTRELRAQRAEIERLARLAAWRDIARAVAHELKNPLTPIHLAVQQTREVYHGDDPEYRRVLEECASIVEEEVRRLRDLVREFSEFARFPAPDPRWGDLDETLGDVARLYVGRVRFEAPRGPVRARYDDAQIRRAVVNLIENGLAACRAAGRREEVRLSLERTSPPAGAPRHGGEEAAETVKDAETVKGADDGGALIRVEDRGAGIAPENLERIFEPDFSTRKEGMGLGLAIVEAVVRGHGGRIEVQSAAGEGTAMSVFLPAASEEA